MNRLPDRTSPPPEPVSHPVSLPIPPPDTRKTHTNLLDLLDVDPVLDFFLAPAADHSLDTPSSPELAPLLFSPGQVAQRRCLPWLRSPPCPEVCQRCQDRPCHVFHWLIQPWNSIFKWMRIQPLLSSSSVLDLLGINRLQFQDGLICFGNWLDCSPDVLDFVVSSHHPAICHQWARTYQLHGHEGICNLPSLMPSLGSNCHHSSETMHWLSCNTKVLELLPAPFLSCMSNRSRPQIRFHLGLKGST